MYGNRFRRKTVEAPSTGNEIIYSHPDELNIFSKIICYYKKNCCGKTEKINSLSVVGGVSNNLYIRTKIIKFLETKNIFTFFPKKEMMSDNAAMIAWSCLNKNIKNHSNISFNADPRLSI